MITPEELKPFLLHEDKIVRGEIAYYFSNAWWGDEEMIPLLLQTVEKYGDKENSQVLSFAKHFPVTESSLPKLLDIVEFIDEPPAEWHVNEILSRIPVHLFEQYKQDIRSLSSVNQKSAGMIPALAAAAKNTKSAAGKGKRYNFNMER